MLNAAARLLIVMITENKNLHCGNRVLTSVDRSINVLLSIRFRHYYNSAKCIGRPLARSVLTSGLRYVIYSERKLTEVNTLIID